MTMQEILNMFGRDFGWKWIGDNIEIHCLILDLGLFTHFIEHLMWTYLFVFGFCVFTILHFPKQPRKAKRRKKIARHRIRNSEIEFHVFYL